MSALWEAFPFPNIPSVLVEGLNVTKKRGSALLRDYSSSFPPSAEARVFLHSLRCRGLHEKGSVL